MTSKSEFPPSEPTRYYTCINCGHAGDYGFVRTNRLECQECGYDSVTSHTVEEIKEHPGLTIKFEGKIQ